MIGTFDHETNNWDHFGDVLDFDAVNHYLCAVKSLMREQRDEGLVTLQNWDLMSEGMKMLLLLVTERKEKVAKGKFYVFTQYFHIINYIIVCFRYSRNNIMCLLIFVCVNLSNVLHNIVLDIQYAFIYLLCYYCFHIIYLRIYHNQFINTCFCSYESAIQ